MQDVNSVTLVGRLTRDPELRSTGSGMSVTSLRVAYTQSRKNGSTGQWEEEAGYIDVTVFGNQADVVSKFLAKGRQIVVQGRLDFRQWQTNEGQQRSATQIIASQVQFIGGNENGQTQQRASNPVSAQSNPSNAPRDDEDIPF
jgi:single-strand DNA-binding protein